MNYSTRLSSLLTGTDSVTLELTPDWLQGRTAYGGWQTALALQAMRRVLGNEPPLRSLQSNFLAPVPPGPVTASATVLRRGKSVAQVEARILIDGKPAFTALGIFGQGRPSGATQRPSAPALPIGPDAVADLPDVPGETPQFMRHFHMRWASGKPPYSGAEDADAHIYVRYRNDAVDSETHLVCLADAIPPSATSLLKTYAPASSINWTLELVEPLEAQERNDWFRFDTHLSAADNGYAWENTAIWSAQGRLIALSRQCVAVFG